MSRVETLSKQRKPSEKRKRKRLFKASLGNGGQISLTGFQGGGFQKCNKPPMSSASASEISNVQYLKYF